VTWPTILAIVELVWVVLAAIWILLEKRTPTATLAWIFGLAFLPVVGVFVYMFLGPRRLRRKRLKRLSALQKVTDNAARYFARAPDPEKRRIAQLMRLAAHKDGFPASTVHAVELYTSGAECFRAIIEAIRTATHHVHVEYYIFDPDQTGTLIRDALVERARAGVEVRLLCDAIGSGRLRRPFLAPLIEAGGQFQFFNPIRMERLFGTSRINFRTHRKIVVVDGRIGFTGGINVHDHENADVNGAEAWRDTHLRLEGNAVRGLQRTFLEDWYFACEKACAEPEYFPEMEAGPIVTQIVASGPDQDAFAIAKVYFSAIAMARERVWLTTPYFVPDEALLFALATAAQRGVDVHLLLSERTDSRWVDAAGRTYAELLLSQGVKVHLYGPPMIHAKTLIVDQDIAIVGTANFDNRSLRLNFEVMAVVYDGAFNTRLGEVFQADLAKAKPRHLREARRPFLERLFEATARLLSPQL
jgi:cardiolipin synthase A/B